MKIIRISFRIRDCWVGVRSKEYRRVKSIVNEECISKNFVGKLESDYCKDKYTEIEFTDYWVCPIPFFKFHLRSGIPNWDEIELVKEKEIL